MFSDKESLKEVLANCHASHVNYFNAKADSIRARCHMWLKNAIDDIRKKHMKERRKARISEIKLFVRSQRRELIPTDTSGCLSTPSTLSEF